jgi:hypothetical protein
MDEIKSKRAAINLLREQMDMSGGNILVNTSKVHRVYYDDNGIMKIEYQDESVGLLSDADFRTMDEAIRKYMGLHKAPRYDLYC